MDLRTHNLITGEIRVVGVFGQGNVRVGVNIDNIKIEIFEHFLKFANQS